MDGEGNVLDSQKSEDLAIKIGPRLLKQICGWREELVTLHFVWKIVFLGFTGAFLYGLFLYSVKHSADGIGLIRLGIAPYVVLFSIVFISLILVACQTLWLRAQNIVTPAAFVLFWSLILFGFWPYLSLDITKSWYAITNGIPVRDITLERKPYDCDFMTAPIGRKHCNYEANMDVFTDIAKTKKLVVQYVKVDD